MPKDPSKVGTAASAVTYAGAEAVDRVMARSHVLGGNEVAIDRATPKDRGAGASAAAAAMLPRPPQHEPAQPAAAGRRRRRRLRAWQHGRGGVPARAGGAGGPARRARDRRGAACAPLDAEMCPAKTLRRTAQRQPPGAQRRGAGRQRRGHARPHAARPRRRGYLDAGGAASAGNDCRSTWARCTAAAARPAAAACTAPWRGRAAWAAPPVAGCTPCWRRPPTRHALAGSASFGSLEGGAGAGPGGGLLRVPQRAGAGRAVPPGGAGRRRRRYHHQAGAGGDAFGSYGHGLDALGGGAYAPGYSQDLARTASDALASSWMGGGGGSSAAAPCSTAAGSCTAAAVAPCMAAPAALCTAAARCMAAPTCRQRLHARRLLHAARRRGSMHGPASARAGPRIFVGKLNKDTSEADVKDYFGTFGFVMDVYLPRDRAQQARTSRLRLRHL